MNNSMFVVLNTGISDIRNVNAEILFNDLLNKFGKENVYIFKNSLYSKDIDKNIYQEISAINIPMALNKVLIFAKEKNIRFLHIFHDDLKIDPAFSAEKYEKFISDFDIGYYNNPKLNPMNKVYEKTVPRFVIETKEYYDGNINVYTFDSPEYMLFDLSINNFSFDEHLPHYYNIEYLWRLKQNKVIPFMNFYFDFDQNNKDMMRDNTNFIRKVMGPTDIQNEKMYLHLNSIQWVPNNNIDDVVNFFIQKRVKL